MAEDDDRKHVRLSAAKRREQFARLVLCRTKLSRSEAALLREVFPEILAMYQGNVRRYLQRRGLDEAEAKDAAQDVFLSLHRKIEAEGFPDSIQAKLYSLAEGAFSNRVRGQDRDPVSIGLPSSGSEAPRTPPDLERIPGSPADRPAGARAAHRRPARRGRAGPHRPALALRGRRGARDCPRDREVPADDRQATDAGADRAAPPPSQRTT